MSRHQKDPLRHLTPDERTRLEHISRSHTEPAAHVARAKSLLAVADGCRFTDAARAAGRRSGDAVGQLVARFNRLGLTPIESGHGGGQPKRYTQIEQERILRRHSGFTPECGARLLVGTWHEQQAAPHPLHDLAVRDARGAVVSGNNMLSRPCR